MEQAETSEHTLVERSRTGDREAYHELYRRHAGRLYLFALRLSREAQEAEEIVQAAFAAAWEKLCQFRGESSFSTWLTSIAINTFRSRRRRLLRWRRRCESLETHALASAEPEACSPESLVDLERAIGELPRRARMVLLLHEIEGYRHEDIAGMLGLSVGTCKAHLHRARSLLRKRLSL